MTQTETQIIKIHGLSFHEGHGVGKADDGKVYFVDQACPGDLVEVEVYKSKKSFAFAKIIKILEPSADRTSPLCDVFEFCGGCSLQHTNYSVQIIEKQKVLKRYLEKSKHNFELLPFEKSERPYEYRNRIEVHVKNQKWGFYQKKSKALIHPEKCHIVNTEINALLENSNLKDGDYHVDTREITLRTRGQEGVFQQINPEINLKLKTYILDILKKFPIKISHFYDLYAGSGNYSLFISEEMSEINFYCVELSRLLVESGKKNSLNKPNIFWIQKSVEQFFTKSNELQIKDSVILINPPRDGVDPKTLEFISKCGVRYLIYVSCNPMTLFRDIDALGPNASLLSLKGFDMFPQTMHFETVAVIQL